MNGIPVYDLCVVPILDSGLLLEVDCQPSSRCAAGIPLLLLAS